MSNPLLREGFRDRDLRAEGLFATEGHLLTERAIAAGIRFEGIWAEPSSARKAAELSVLAASSVPAGSDEAADAVESSPIPVTILDPPDLDRLAGFPFHRGLLALARRPAIERATPAFAARLWAADLSAGSIPAAIPSAPRRVLCLPESADPGNLGTLLRSALAFGFTDVLLGERSCDPFNRKALRASMGAAFRLRLFEADPSALSLCAANGIPVYAAALEDGAVAVGSPIGALSGAPSGAFDVALGGGIRPDAALQRRSGSFVLVLGNEYSGIPADWRLMCSKALMIPVGPDVDSLNVAIAGSILMWELSCRGLP